MVSRGNAALTATFPLLIRFHIQLFARHSYLCSRETWTPETSKQLRLCNAVRKPYHMSVLRLDYERWRIHRPYPYYYCYGKFPSKFIFLLYSSILVSHWCLYCMRIFIPKIYSVHIGRIVHNGFSLFPYPYPCPLFPSTYTLNFQHYFAYCEFRTTCSFSRQKFHIFRVICI